MKSPKTKASAPSSSEYSVDLKPDDRVRTACELFSLTVTLAGLLLLASADIYAYFRVPAMVAWICVSEFRVPMPDCVRLRLFANGDVLLLDSRGGWTEGRVQGGSVIVRPFAWLRVTMADGRRYSALFPSRGSPTAEWRRLQVIGRHLGPV